MKYWFYSEGNILGPYEPAEMLALPAFAEESLVCPETATGDNPGDWRPASQVGEISAVLSVGAGRSVNAGAMAGAYEYETGVSYFTEKEPEPDASYGELLNTIDNILGSRKDGQAAALKPGPEADYDLADKFDIRLSRIQEELEAARWEKNLLLEKIRMKDLEEKKNRERIQELEVRLKREIGKSEANASELELARLAALKEKTETIRRIAELKKEELLLKEYMDQSPARPGPSAQAPAEKTEERPAIAGRQEPAEKAEERTAGDAQPEPAAQVQAQLAIVPRSEPAEKAEERPAAAAMPEQEEKARESAVPPSEDKPLPEVEVKHFKTISRSTEITLESSLGREAGQEEGSGIASHTFKSLGQTQEPAYVYGSRPDKKLPEPEAAPAGAFKVPETFEPLPQQAGGLVYDFTVVTAKPETSQTFKIEPVQSSAKSKFQPQPVEPPTFDFGVQSQHGAGAALPQPQAEALPTFKFPHAAPSQAKPGQPPAAEPEQQAFAATVQHGFQFPEQSNRGQAVTAGQFKTPEIQSFSPSARPAPEPPLKVAAAPAVAPAAAPAIVPAAAPVVFPDVVPASVPAAAPVVAAPISPAVLTPADSPDKTLRVPMPAVKAIPELKVPDKPKRKGGKLAFIAVLVIFGSIAAGGIGYFFMGEGVSFSEFSMLNLGGKKKNGGMTSQLEAKAEPAKAPEPFAGEPQAPVQPPKGGQTPPSAPEKPANENILKSLEIVKNYRLSGGRGTIKSWFANSFLSGAAGGTNEEWTATPLHGNILVVQYRLLRPRQEPMIYQFEVDAAKRDIVRGINNNAIDLLDFSSREKKVSVSSAKKPAFRPKAKKSPRSGELPILPLPDAPAETDQQEQDPTGFENVQGEGSEQVKYLKAQESDEELF